MTLGDLSVSIEPVAGGFRHPRWTNLDYASDRYASSQGAYFVNHDLMSLKPLPFKSGAVSLVYSSHTIEHVSDAAVEVMVREALRMLKPGGVLRLTCPDMLLAYEAWKRNDRAFFYFTEGFRNPKVWRQFYTMPPGEASITQLFLGQFATHLSNISIAPSKHKYSDSDVKGVFEAVHPEDALTHFTNECHYDRDFAGHHISWWSPEKLLRVLGRVGFARVYRSGYGQSCAPPLRNTYLFDSTHPKLSVYVEAVKGGGA